MEYVGEEELARLRMSLSRYLLRVRLAVVALALGWIVSVLWMAEHVPAILAGIAIDQRR